MPPAASPKSKVKATLGVLLLGIAAAVGLEVLITRNAATNAERAQATLAAPALPPTLAIDRARTAEPTLPTEPAPTTQGAPTSLPPAAEAAGQVPAATSASSRPERPSRAAKPEPETEDATANAEPAVHLAPFDAQTAEIAIGEGAVAAQTCKQPGGLKGVAVVTITFAPSGRATTATVSGEPFAGTAIGGCIAEKIRAVRVPPFSGDFITVKKTIPLE